MNFRISMLVIGLMVWNALVVEAQVIDNDATSAIEESGQSTTNLSEQPAENLEQPLPIPVPDEASMIESVVAQLHLNMFEAAMGDLSLCKDDEMCLRHTPRIKSWLCAASACEKKNKAVRDCFDEDDVPREIELIVDTLVCPMVLSPSDTTRQAILDVAPETSVDELAEYGAYILAVKEGAGSCHDHIKNYLQTHGSNKYMNLNRVLAGCRILSHTTTREQEEAEFRRQATSTVTEIPPASASPAYDKQ